MNAYSRTGRNGAGIWRRIALASCVTLGFAALAALPAAAPARADDGSENARFDDGGSAPSTYTDGDGGADTNSDPAAVAADAANSGPVRMARFTTVEGDVTWRGGTDGDWATGVANMPLRQGAQIWVSEGGHAEIQFDDGSRLRLDSNTLVTLQTLYSDTKGEYTEITLNDGEVALRATNEFSYYQVNTPLCSVKAAGPARVRVGAGVGVQVAVQKGTATVQGSADHARLHDGDYIDLADNATAYDIVDIPKDNAWDAYNVEQDRALDSLTAKPTAQHLPPNIATTAGDLDAYGTWREDAEYGWVWVPHTSDASWRPYYQGHWTWVEPFGWTWVSSEPWGWAPYHYGTWVHAGWGWSWVPGPRNQYWSPGTVAFYQNEGQVAWCPLAPREVRYPSTITLGFHSGNWSTYFSVGGAAVYYPGERNVCYARPWAPTYLNHGTYITHVTNVTNVTNITNVTVNRNTYITHDRFVASNARYGGAVSVSTLGFGGNHGERYHAVERNDTFISHARVVGAPVGGRPLAGPPAWHPTTASFSPTRTFHQGGGMVPRPILEREVYRAAPPAVVSYTAPAQPGQHFRNPTTGGRPAFGGGRSGDTRGGNVSGNVSGDRTGRPSENPGGGLQDYLRNRNGRTSGGGAVMRPNVESPSNDNGSRTGTRPFGGSRTNTDAQPSGGYRPNTDSQPSGNASGNTSNRGSNRGFGNSGRTTPWTPTTATPPAATTPATPTTPNAPTSGYSAPASGGRPTFGGGRSSYGGTRVLRGSSDSTGGQTQQSPPTSTPTGSNRVPFERTPDSRTSGGGSVFGNRSNGSTPATTTAPTTPSPTTTTRSDNNGRHGGMNRDAGIARPASRDSGKRDTDSSKKPDSGSRDKQHDNKHGDS